MAEPNSSGSSQADNLKSVIKNFSFKCTPQSDELKVAAIEEFQELLSNMLNKLPNKEEVLSSEHEEPDKKSAKNLEPELTKAKLVFSALNEATRKLKEEFANIKKEIKEKKSRDKLILRKMEELKTEFALLSKVDAKSQDEVLKEVNIVKMRYRALRNMTQVRFDFEESENDILKGIVYNSVNKKAKIFKINNVSNYETNQTLEKIITCMEEVSNGNYTDLFCD